MGDQSDFEGKKSGEESGAADTRRTRLPPLDFSGFIVSMAQAALVHFGDIPDPATGQISRNIEQARYSIDLIDMLVEKTRGNLTPEEDVLIRRVQNDLKLRFVRSR
jgi:hypothetical protein